MYDTRRLSALRARQLAAEHHRLARQGGPRARAHSAAGRAYERASLAHGRGEGRARLFGQRAREAAERASGQTTVTGIPVTGP